MWKEEACRYPARLSTRSRLARADITASHRSAASDAERRWVGCHQTPTLRNNQTTAPKKSCWYRGLLLRCQAESHEHQRNPDSVRRGWSRTPACLEPEYRMADRPWSRATWAKPKLLAAHFLRPSPAEEAADLDCRVVLRALPVRLGSARPDDALVVRYPRMKQKQSQQDRRATVSIS